MLTPRQYDEWPQPLVSLAQQLEEYLIRDIARRLSKEDFSRFTATGYQQAERLISWNGIPLDEISKKIAQVTGKLESEIDRLFQETYEKSLETVGDMYEKLGEPVPDNPLIAQTIEAQASQTKVTFQNLTGSIGFAIRQNGILVFTPIANAYQKTLDSVQMKILSGGVAPNVAIKNAVRDLANSGLRTVDYASGVKSSLDVAVRRATVTGLSQITGFIAEEQARDLNTDLVEVSAHSGARDTGTGYENHKAWQGKIYSLSGRHPKYPSLRTETGYGNVAGLKGANCRHDFSPFVEGVSVRQWTEKQLREIDHPPFVFDGVQYTAYMATQRQRQMESAMRLSKRRYIAYKAAGLLEDARQESAKIARQRDLYLQFSKAAKLEPQIERAQVSGYRS